MALTKNVTIAILGKDKTRAAASSSVVNLKRVGAAAKAMGKAMAVAAGLAVVAFARVIKNNINLADSTAKLSQKIGVSVEDLSTLELALGLTGTGMQSFQTGVRTLSQRMLDASRGLKSSKDDFDDLGLSVTDANGELRDNFDVLLDVADAFEGMEDGTQKAALAQKLLGRAGGELIPLLNQGSEGIRKMQEESRQLGVVISSKTAAAAEQFNDDLLRMQTVMRGFALDILNRILPALQILLGWAKDWLSDGGNAKIIVDKLASGFQILSVGAVKAANSIAAFSQGMGTLSVVNGAQTQESQAARMKAAMDTMRIQMDRGAAMAKELEESFAKASKGAGGRGTLDFLTDDFLENMHAAEAKVNSFGSTVQSSFRNAGSSIVSAAINARDMGEAAKGAGLAAVQMFADMLIQKGLMAAFDTFNKTKAIAEQTAIGAAGAATGAAVGAAWQPAALATSLASFGANSVPAIAGITATAAALAGATALSSGIGFAGQAHDGIVFPSSGSYLMNVQKGESIVPNLPSGDRGGSSSAPMAVNVMLGTRTLARGIVEAVKGGVLSLKVNSSGHVVAA
tara:strand:- start:3405 stop:5114 length:1710 start_codon:yes stop_codon:yes gene_type:complete